MELGKAIPRDIVISPSANGGFLVRTGCGVFTYEYGTPGRHRLVSDLENYLRDPAKWELKYNKAMNSTGEGSVPEDDGGGN